MVLGFLNTLDYLFVARSSIKSVEELKGKRVAIGTPSGLPGLMTYMVSRPLRPQSQEGQYHSFPDRKCSRTHGSTACREC